MFFSKLTIKERLTERQKDMKLYRPIKANKWLFIRLAIAIVVAGFIYGIFTLIRATSVAASEFITRYISNGLVGFVGFFTSLMPYVSMFEMLLMTAILSVAIQIVWTILDLRKKRFSIVLRRALILILVVISCFNYYALTAGFSYNRADISNGINLSQTRHQEDDLNSIANHFMDDFNTTANTLTNYSDNLSRCENGYLIIDYTLLEIGEMLRDCFRRALDGNRYFFCYTPRPKVFMHSWWFSIVGVAGMAFLPTGEGHTNFMPPTLGNILVMAHELAHMRGVMRENDADLVAFYVLVTSPNLLLRYIGYMYTMHHLARAVYIGNPPRYRQALEQEFFDSWPSYAWQDMATVWRWWRDFRENSAAVQFLNRVGDFFNDLYLRLSGVEDGTGSYGYFPDGDIDTGIVDPDTGDNIFIPFYNNVQKMFFAIYENRVP